MLVERFEDLIYREKFVIYAKKTFVDLLHFFLLIILLNCTNNKAEITQSIKRGEQVYINRCLTCHMANGKGVPDMNPPLANADYLMVDKKRSIRQIIYGAKGKMKVNNVIYNGDMPAQLDITNEEVADVLNYIRNSWGNKGEIVTPAEVQAERE